MSTELWIVRGAVAAVLVTGVLPARRPTSLPGFTDADVEDVTLDEFLDESTIAPGRGTPGRHLRVEEDRS